MSPDLEQRLVSELKQYVTENLPLSKISDEELEERIEDIVEQRLSGQYCSIEQRLSIVRQIYSSIRGFGLLDSIISDDTITEVMINGPEHIFIEQNGRLFKLDKQFESQRRLEDVIQRIVGLAGREVNQANPICDTRLPDGSRVNVVLPPIALCGPVLTIRKFSKTPMTIEKLISYGSITQEIADKLELLVRARLVGTTRLQPNRLHTVATHYVSAHAQNLELDIIEPMLTDAEAAVLRRGKNASKATVAKHATVQEYRASTGFECLLGWLYLQGRNDRIEELFNAMWDGYKPE